MLFVRGMGRCVRAVWWWGLVALTLCTDAVCGWYDAGRVAAAVCCLELEEHWPLLTVWAEDCRKHPDTNNGVTRDERRAKFKNAALRHSLTRRRRGRETAARDPGASATTLFTRLCAGGGDGGGDAVSFLAPEAVAFYLENALCQRELPRTARELVDTPLSEFLEADPTDEDGLIDLVTTSCSALKREWTGDSGELVGRLLLLRRRASEVAQLLCKRRCSSGAPVDREDL